MTCGAMTAMIPPKAPRKTSSVATAVALSTTYNWDATPLVKGNGLVSMVVKSPNSDGARYFSKEGSSTQAPKLTVTCGAGGGTDTAAPTTPTNLAGTAPSSTTVNLSWAASTDNVGVTGYRIYRNNGTTPIGTSTTTAFSATLYDSNFFAAAEPL